MKQLFCLAALLALAVARPELYKETEDFQYSRSSSDEGSKAGYYGAKRGNMGGNYEKAHNMDHLAQNQMSGLVSQVHGEIGEAAKLRTGNVFADANSRGIYGSGNYDLSNLQGRNFQEGFREGSFADTHSALASQNSGYAAGQAASHHSSGYNSHSENSRYTGYQGTKSAQALHSANLQASGEAANAYNYGRQAGYSSGHSSQYGYQGATHNSDYGVAPSNRLIVTTPARIIVRPGGRVAVPVGVQTYDTTHSASIMDHNAINTEAEVLSVPDHVVYKPSSNSKYYESASNYQKHWEKHETKPEVIPLAIPTENPFPRNSELYDDSLHTSALNSQSASNAYSGYNAHVKSASSQSQYQAAHDSQYAAGHNLNTHGAYIGGLADTYNGLEESRPKSHQSSYSYHKAWERQGDPYVIQPAGIDTASQRLTAGSANQGYASSHQYEGHTKSSQQRYSQNAIDCDCDENGQIRVARSVGTQDREDLFKKSQAYEDLGQQQQNIRENLKDLDQQSQTTWDHQGQRASDNLKEFGQQTQQEWGDLTQQAQTGWNRQSQAASEKFEDLGQQTQKQWGDLTQQAQTGWNRQAQGASERFEELGQQTQKQWGDLTQQAQTGWNQQRQRTSEKLEDFGQQSQNQWGDLTQQAQTSWGDQGRRADQKLEDFGQQAQTDLGQQTQHVTWDKEDKAVFSKPENQNDMVKKPLNQWQSEDQGLVQAQASDINEQQVQTNSAGLWTLYSFANNDTRDKVNSFQTRHINSEGKDYQQYNWQIDQDPAQPDRDHYYDDEDLLQSSQQAYDSFFHGANINKDVSINTDGRAKPKPVWEQTDAHEQRVVQNTFPGMARPKNPWKPMDDNQQNTLWNIDNKWQKSINGSRNESQNTQAGSSLPHSLWDKINNLEHKSSAASGNEQKIQNGSFQWQGQSSSERWHHYRWDKNKSEESNLTSQHNFTNQYGSGYSGYNPWIPMIGDPGIINPSGRNVAVKPKDGTQSERVRPVDMGRGDIGSEDSFKTTTTEKVFVSGSNHGFPIFTEDYSRREKTPEEIEALSLTRDVDRANKPKSHLGRMPTEGTEQHSQDTLKVLGLEEQKLHGFSNGSQTTSNITYGSRRTGDFNRRNLTNTFTNTNEETQQTESQSARHFFYNTPGDQSTIVTSNMQAGNNFFTNRPLTSNRDSTKPRSDSQQKLNSWQDSQNTVDHTGQNMEQQFEYPHFGTTDQRNTRNHFEQIEQNANDQNLEQQSQGAWGQDFTDFGQQEQVAWVPESLLNQSTQQAKLGKSNSTQDFYNQRYNANLNAQKHAEDLKVPPETSENEDSQSRPDFNDFGQQEQVAWVPESLQKPNTQQAELGKSNSDQYQAQDFYNQRYYANLKAQKQSEDLKALMPPETSENKDSQSKNERTPLAPMEPTTQKPGFWKSVGSKLTNAKDKVASWFKGS